MCIWGSTRKDRHICKYLKAGERVRGENELLLVKPGEESPSAWEENQAKIFKNYYFKNMDNSIIVSEHQEANGDKDTKDIKGENGQME